MQPLPHGSFDQDGFRLRSEGVSRLEAFSDVVFGFALTLLVVSLEVPKTFAELHHMLSGFIPFTISFVILIRIWIDHYRFFRRFGLHNEATLRINFVLLFVILFAVYPLKFLFTMVAGLTFNHGASSGFTGLQIREIMVLYGVGFASMYILLALLNHQGWLQRKVLALTPREQLLTRSYIVSAAGVAGVAILSCAVAYLLPHNETGWAGLVYVLISPWKFFHDRHTRTQLARLDHGQRHLHPRRSA